MKEESTKKNPYSQRIMDLASKPKHRGAYFKEDALERKMVLVEGKFKDLKVYWLVHPDTDQIYSAKFFAYGGTLSLAIGEIMCDMIEGKNFTDPNVFSLQELEAQLRDDPDTPAFENQTDETFQAVPEILKETRKQYPDAKALSLAAQTVAEKNEDPRDFESLSEKGKAWLETDKKTQLEQIEEVLTKDVRPGLNMDGGDITVIDLQEGYKLKVNWEGACGGCASSAGATLSFLEDKLKKDVFEGMQVISDSAGEFG